MYYIVTGAAGFIGSSIIKELNNRGIDDVIAVDEMTNGDKCKNLADCKIADFLDIDEFATICDRFDKIPDTKSVLHNGACADTMEYNGRYMMQRNFAYSKRVFMWCRHFNLPMVYASSASVYGVGKISKEDPRYELPINVYAYSKLSFDQYVRKQYSSCHNSVVGLRYFNVYGIREASKGKMASMVYQLAKQLRTTGTAKLFTGTDGYSDGGQLRDFVCVEDVAKVNLFFADNPQIVKGVFNVGTGHARSFNDVANTLIKLNGKGTIEYIPFPEKLIGKYQSFTQADLTNLRHAGYQEPFLTLEEGIAKCWSCWSQR